jgi:hypothetical protein
MFESAKKAVLAHKHVVIAAIAVTGLVAYVLPGNMFATAQNGVSVGTDGVTVDVSDGNVYVVTPGVSVSVTDGQVDIGFSFL